MSSELQVKVAVITGAARGIGFEVAQKFHSEKYHVVIIDYNKEALQACKAKLKGKKRYSYFLCDVSKPRQIQKVFDQVTKKFDAIVLDPPKLAPTAAHAERAARERTERLQRLTALLADADSEREVARIVLPLNIYSSMYVTMNARALMNFLSLRTKREGTHFPSFPQREIEMCAEQMEEFFAELMPYTYEAFNQHGRVAP